MDAKVKVKQALQRLNLIENRNSAASLHWGSHRAEFGVEKYITDFVLEPSPNMTMSVEDSVLGGFQHRHAFGDRAVFRLQRAQFDPYSGGVFLGSIFVRESLSSVEKIPSISAGLSCSQVDGALIGVPTSSYYHWLLEIVPRIITAANFEPEATLVASETLSTAQRAALATISDNVHFCNRLHASDELILATYGSDSGWPHPNDVTLLRRHFSVPESSGTTAIYVSRIGARRSDRETKRAHDFAVESGWMVVRGEDLSWRQHLEIFGGAQIIAGEHGAGLSNVVLAPVGAESIELFRPDYANPCFSALNLALGKDTSQHRAFPLSEYRTALGTI